MSRGYFSDMDFVEEEFTVPRCSESRLDALTTRVHAVYRVVVEQQRGPPDLAIWLRLLGPQEAVTKAKAYIVGQFGEQFLKREVTFPKVLQCVLVGLDGWFERAIVWESGADLQIINEGRIMLQGDPTAMLLAQTLVQHLAECLQHEDHNIDARDVRSKFEELVTCHSDQYAVELNDLPISVKHCLLNIGNPAWRDFCRKTHDVEKVGSSKRQCGEEKLESGGGVICKKAENEEKVNIQQKAGPTKDAMEHHAMLCRPVEKTIMTVDNPTRTSACPSSSCHTLKTPTISPFDIKSRQSSNPILELSQQLATNLHHERQGSRAVGQGVKRKSLEVDDEKVSNTRCGSHSPSDLPITSSTAMLEDSEHHVDAAMNDVQLENLFIAMGYDRDIIQLAVKATRHEQGIHTDLDPSQILDRIEIQVAKRGGPAPLGLPSPRAPPNDRQSVFEGATGVIEQPNFPFPVSGTGRPLVWPEADQSSLESGPLLMPVERFIKRLKIPYKLRLPDVPGLHCLRHIIVDGCNVAMRHGINRFMSCRGIALCVKYFWDRGHRKITVFVPQHRSHRTSIIKESHFLEQLEELGIVSYTPSRMVEGRRISAHDDRILQFTFAEDIFMVPDDPLGPHGPNVDAFLCANIRPHSHNQNAGMQPQLSTGPISSGPISTGLIGTPASHLNVQRTVAARDPIGSGKGELREALLNIFPTKEDDINRVLNLHPNEKDLNLLSSLLLDE
uniref:NEDD4-binding protein 1-like isoform X2 n=1 Tax=Myxine glutinosa TaxID=7769 RepID=UPI00358EB9C9